MSTFKAHYKIIGGEKLQAELLALGGAAGEARLARANQKSADEFMTLLRSGVPVEQHGSWRGGAHLVDTIEQKRVGATGVAVSIGNANMPYPAHLELGHRARDGSQVAAKPFWFPAKRVAKARAVSRTKRAESAVAKSIANG